MTDRSRGMGGAVGPPWSVDLLADLHAGVLDEQQSAELWPQVKQDPEANAILDALDSTSADLAGLADAPPEPMPAEFAARLDAAVAEESRQRSTTMQPQQAAAPQASPQQQEQLAPVVSMDAARRRRNKQIGWGAGILTAAAAAVAVVAIAVPGANTTDGDAVAQPPAASDSAEPPLALKQDGLNAGAIAPAMGATDYGPLGGPDRLDACIAANGLESAGKPLGVKGVTVDGQPATLVILKTGNIGQLQLVAVPPTCGEGSPGTVFDKTVG